MNWTCEITVQHCYLNRRPSTKNCYTTIANFAGMTKEAVMEQLEAMKIRYGFNSKVVAHSEIKPMGN